MLPDLYTAFPLPVIAAHAKPWTLPTPDLQRSAKVGHARRLPVRHAVCAKPGATILGPSVATVLCRGSSASTLRRRRALASKWSGSVISLILFPSGPLLKVTLYCESETEPVLSPTSRRSGFDSANQEILQRLGHIASLLEDIKQDGSSTMSSSRSLRSSFFELAMQNPSPLTDIGLMGSTHGRGSSASGDDRACEHDPFLIYAASSPELMLRWPIYNKVITDAEKHIRSFLLDSLDNQPQTCMSPPRQASIGPLVDDIQQLCRKYLRLVHRRNPVIDIDKLEHYAREVTVQGLGWDGPSCQVVCFQVFVSVSF